VKKLLIILKRKYMKTIIADEIEKISLEAWPLHDLKIYW